MAAFRFRLQKLLELAATTRQARARDLNAARAQEQGAALDLDRSQQLRLSHLDALRTTPADGPLDLETWSAGRERYRDMRTLESDAAARLRGAEQAVSNAQGAFIAARREGAVLQRLRDRQQDAWRAEAAAAEQAVLDEVAGRLGGDAGKRRR